MSDHDRETYVFVVQHARSVADEDDVKFIGVYRTEASARSAVARLSTLPGFIDHPEGFAIDRYELDRDHWTDGFVREPEADVFEGETPSS